MIVVLLGPPGSGKGTLASALAPPGGAVSVFEMGHALRRWAAGASPDQSALRASLAAGNLAPPELVASLLDTFLLSRVGDTSGVLLDGFPRSAEQCTHLLRLHRTGVAPLAGVIALAIPAALAVSRCARRRTCAACQVSFSAATSLAAACCPTCGAPGLTRADDASTPAIQRRLDLYETVTAPVLAHFREASIPVASLDATLSAPAVLIMAQRLAFMDSWWPSRAGRGHG